MHFDFLKELFPKYVVEFCFEEDVETVYIRNSLFDFPIVVHYFPDDYYKYLLRFATQHRDTSSKDDLISYIFSFINADIFSVIELYPLMLGCTPSLISSISHSKQFNR